MINNQDSLTWDRILLKLTWVMPRYDAMYLRGMCFNQLVCFANSRYRSVADLNCRLSTLFTVAT